MNFVFVVLLLLDISLSKGQQQTGGKQKNIVLRLAFPPFYNSYPKSCCKLYPGGCYLLLDSDGYTCDFLKGRVTKTQSDGWIEFTISNLQFNDQGLYRCLVMGGSFYNDYYIEVTETLNSFTKLPHKTSTAPVREQDHTDTKRDPWSLPLPSTVSIIAMICICSVAGFIFCLLKAKQKQSNKNLAESLQTDTSSEINTIVYTTVDFKAHPKPTELYENLRVHKKQEGRCAPVHDGNVEYSTLAIH